MATYTSQIQTHNIMAINTSLIKTRNILATNIIIIPTHSFTDNKQFWEYSCHQYVDYLTY